MIDALSYVKLAPGIDKMKLVDLNGVDLELNKKATFESVIATWHKEQEELALKKHQEHEEWLNSPEGQQYTQQKEKEKAEHDAFVFHSVDEALLALSDVKPCLLSSPNTSHADAMRFCKEVMEIILKCEDLHFNSEQQAALSATLLLLGARKSEQLNDKFRTSEGNIGTLMNSKNNIQFPVAVFDQLIETKESTFNFGLSKVTEGGLKNSWIGQWLEAQKEKEKTLNNPDKK